MIEPVRARLAELGYVAGWQLVRRVPQPVAAAVFRAGADRAASRSGARQLRANLAQVRPDADPDELTRAALRSYARYWREVFRLPVLDPAELYATVDPLVAGQEHLDKALVAGRGAILALPHTGNWDVAGVWLLGALRSRGHPARFTTVVERQRPAALHRRFVRYRESLGFEILLLDDARVAATLAARLREGGVVCLLADRDLTAAGVPVDFFGAEVRMPSGPARLAGRTGAALLPVGSWFDGDDGWGFRISPAVPVTADPADVPRATQQLANVFAGDIAEHPADWHVLQRFWPA